MRALITGGRGFVGGWLAAHLRDQGDDLVVVDHEVDVTSTDRLGGAFRDAQPDVVYHLAALTHVGQSWEDPVEVQRVNVLGTASVLAAARACGSDPRVLVVSSAEVYGTVTDESALPLGEDARLAPTTPYAASKVAAEYLCVQAHLAHDLPVIRVRPFNHVGPGQGSQFVVPALAARIVEAQRAGGGDIPIGNLQARRDLTDVRDVVRAYRLLVRRGAPGQVYNVCRGQTVAIAEVADRLLQLAGAELRLVTDPALVRPVDVPVVQGDATLLRQTTGWEPGIDLDTTLADVLAECSQRAG